MTYEVASVLCGGNGPQQSYYSDVNPNIYLDNAYDNSDNVVSPCHAYNELLRDNTADILMYIHDDVTIHDAQWVDRVMRIFRDRPRCVCVGLGGAWGLGHDDLYKTRFRMAHMARQGYASNQTDWKTHGTHEKGDKRVAVVDAFFLAVRTDFMGLVGGWPVGHLTHHCLDLWIACEAARHGREVWMTGVNCTHHGGGSSTKPMYKAAKWLQGRSLEQDHYRPHRWLYEEYKDVLPIRVS